MDIFSYFFAMLKIFYKKAQSTEDRSAWQTVKNLLLIAVAFYVLFKIAFYVLNKIL